jgi:hypothetical protein
MKIRAAETLMPYFHGKQPVKVDATIRGVMVVEEIGTMQNSSMTIDLDPLGLMAIGEDGDG